LPLPLPTADFQTARGLVNFALIAKQIRPTIHPFFVRSPRRQRGTVPPMPPVNAASYANIPTQGGFSPCRVHIFLN